MPKGQVTKTQEEQEFATSARTMQKIMRLAQKLTPTDRNYLAGRLAVNSCCQGQQEEKEEGFPET